MSEQLTLPAKWVTPEGLLIAEPAPGVWCMTPYLDVDDDDPNFAVFDLEGDPRIGAVEPAPDGAVVIVTNDDEYRERLSYHAETVEFHRQVLNRNR